MTVAKIYVNNMMRVAHAAGLGRNFLDYGTTNDIVEEGTSVGGSAPRDFDYYYADDPGTRHHMTFRDDLWNPDRRPGEEHHGYASGGPISGGDVRGPGSSIGDKIPAWLSDGEFVMNAKSTEVNRQFLQALNQDPYFLQKMLAQAAGGGGRGSGGGAPGPAAQPDRPALVNISTVGGEDVIGRLKVLAAQWELMHAR